jgi:tetratricopeptide (TPR) repeat protein
MRRAGLLLIMLIIAATASLRVEWAIAAKLGYSRANCLSGAITARDAISACTAVLQKFPDNPKVWLRRGAAFGEIGAFDFAIGDFSRAIRLAPQNALAFHLRGLVREIKGELQESLNDYMRELEIDPSDQELERAIFRVTDAFAALSLKEQPQRILAEAKSDERRPAPDRVGAQEASARKFDSHFSIAPAILVLATLTIVVSRLSRKRRNRRAAVV